jgi:ESS family glutamate:Na+ symporter
MVGGHGYSAAFGQTINVADATSVGIASATLGLILGGIIGSPISKYLIEKYKLKPTNFDYNLSNNKSGNINLTSYSFFIHILLILVCMNLGELFSNLIFKTTTILVPVIVGCMFVSVFFRLFNDKVSLINLDFKLLDFLSDLSLSMFLTIALMSIDLYKLSNLFSSIIIIVLFQVIFIVAFSVFICFKVLGGDFDAAVCVSGMIGHCLGATPNAISNMTSVCEKYGNSKKAFLIVPLVGAFLLDMFNMPSILLFINLLS